MPSNNKNSYTHGEIELSRHPFLSRRAIDLASLGTLVGGLGGMGYAYYNQSGRNEELLDRVAGGTTGLVAGLIAGGLLEDKKRKEHKATNS